MAVQLQAIKLNHDPTSASVDALNIRRNGSAMVTVPEWQQGVSANPEDSPACYAIMPTKGNTLTIQAKFVRTDENLKKVQIRALDADVEPPDQRGGCIGFVFRLLRIILRAIFGNVLGQVVPRTVDFGPTGETSFETFQLSNVRLWSVGIGVRTTSWRWQYRRNPSQPWTDFETTRHRIYVVLDVPPAPWQQAPYSAANAALPWTDALDYACSWAILKASADDAATAITNGVFKLGPGTVTYDCPGGGYTHYALGAFDCTAFIERLKGGPGNGIYVNCTDCATIVSTFSNLVGCDLWQSRMASGFALNPILAIGSALWEPACLSCSCGWSGSFSYHEVAWKGACTENDNVFDGCLKVDGDADPTSAPHSALLVADMRFGFPGDGDYRDRLATPAGRPHCNPQPGTRQRRAII